MHFYFLFPLAVFLLTVGRSQAELLFPLEPATRVTGSFAENRGLHFHAGVDLSTEGREGWPVRAAADGWLYRLRVSPHGYGKAVYLKLNDGCFAVYAHLRDFAPFLDEIARARQSARGSFRINYYPPPGRVEIKRGQVIGFSGASGTSVPHLHFELRDAGERPLNPLTHGLTVTDGDRPAIEGVAIRPRDGSSGVGGFREVYLLSRPQTGRKTVIPVWGRVGVEAAAFDPSGDNRLGVYQADLRIDGQIWFVNRFEEFSYRQYHLAPRLYDRELDLRGKKDFQRLYRAEGDPLPFQSAASGRTGCLQTLDPGKPGFLAPGDHVLSVSVRDAAGHEDRTELTLRAEKPSVWKLPPRLRDEAGKKKEAGLFPVFRGRSLIVYVRTGGFPPEELSLIFRKEETAGRRVALAPVEAGGGVGAVELGPEDRGRAVLLLGKKSGGKPLAERSLRLQPVTPGEGGAVVSGDGKARAAFGAGSVPELLFPRFRRRPAEGFPELRPVGDAYLLEPAAAALDSKARISLRLPEGGEGYRAGRTALYRLGDDGPIFLGRTGAENDGWRSGLSRVFGTFALFEDTTPPEVSFLPAAGREPGEPLAEVSGRVRDRGSGIEDTGLELRIDGEAVIAEYVPAENIVRHRPRQDLSPGPHSLSLTVRDRVGNLGRAQARLTIEPTGGR